VYIPHFCYHKKLSIAANCRMCLVQVEKAPKPLPACATPVTNGMKVFTHSELAVKAQKGVMEFLLINHPLDCPICDQGGECQLQDMSVGYGGVKSRYQEEKRVVFHKDVGPLISMQEMSRCIHCTRCVRFGQEVAGIMELGMANRNMHSEITTFVGRSVDSELSGNMIDLCPVGALTSKPFRYTARSWELQRYRSVSLHDAMGSNVQVQVKGGKVMRVIPHENEAINECWISDRDRFSYEALDSDTRLTRPMIKQGGEWREVEWNVALDYVAHGLKNIATESGGDAIAALVSPQATVEEMYLAKQLLAGLGSQNIDFRLRQADFTADGKRAGTPWLGMSIAEISELDAGLVVGSFLRQEHPLLAQRLRTAARKGGEISLISVAGNDELIKFAQRKVVAPARLVSALAGVVAAAAQLKGEAAPVQAEADEVAKAIAQNLIDGESKAVLLGNVAAQVADAAQIHFLAQELARLTGAKFGFLGDGANSVAAYALGLADAGANTAQMFAQPRKGYLLYGIEAALDLNNQQAALAAFKQAEMVVVASAFKQDAALEFADILLPLAAFTETSGTLVNTEGRVQSFNGIVKPAGAARPGWKILRVLANVLNLPGFQQESSEQVRDEALQQADGFVTGLNNAIAPVTLEATAVAGLQRITDIPVYASDMMVRRASSLQKTAAAATPVVKMATSTATEIGCADAAQVKVSQAGGSVQLALQLDEAIPAGCVRVAGGCVETAGLGQMFGPIQVERV
jgi:NADH-quinone oxidoreductase subunit G